jgi:hypothetical protein
MKPKHSAAKLFSPDNTGERNLGIALFGDVVWTERQEVIIKLVGLFEKIGGYSKAERKVPQPFCEREFDRLARPLLIEALLKQDTAPFKEFAAAIEAAKRIKKVGPVHPLEAEMIRLEDERQFGKKPVLDNTELNGELAKRLLDGTDKEQVRRAAKRLGIPLKSGKLGAPKKVRRITRRQNRR